ncbi:transformation system protein [Campylobacter upsaliensis]|uniref:transformation system protein n=1 Tax=Campylobacter TaxID=194 RepID=UPI0002EDEC72|nr:MULTISPECIES: transformation system protein [Campylobacter]EHJ8978566.1 transformation system protein [Campylobacter upsaliensis]EHR9974192.1 transformation system protein [Campylobacter upsaliensis]EIB1178524.1 transformation system protein [Campylobacter upsaliensis]EIG0595837.1 transformation system protein [Campylobacter upsaliensis]EIJ6627712.1 transformation system protein [Campylobacter upsaliensis]
MHAQDLQNKLLNLQNPFLNPTLEQMAKLEIQAIFPQKVRINNKWYKENDLIHNAILRRIDARSVIFEYDEQNITLEFRQNAKIFID